MKSTLETRPLYVRTDEHRIARLTLCTIALILLRLIQRAITNKLSCHPSDTGKFSSLLTYKNKCFLSEY